MKVGVICIGDELLIGQTVNTNAAWLGQAFRKLGISVYKATTIRDVKQDIIDTVDAFFQETDLVIVTGGLGPTNDDITKSTLTEYFGTSLELNKTVLAHVERFFKRRNKEMLESNIQQAMLPKGATILHNENGTAPGMWFEQNNKTLISLPGVPYEMKSLMKDEVLPLLKSKFKILGSFHQTVMLQGIGESFLAEKINRWEKRLYQDKLHLAYLPSPGIIKLRITSDKGIEDAGLIQSYIEEIRTNYPQYVYGLNGEDIFEVVGHLLKQNNATVGTVESCTGGGIANSFVANSGSSEYFQGGLITYSNELKHKLANVPEDILNKYGAVSEEVAKAMALGGQKVLNTDYVIAVTGIAGPNGGTEDKPVGLVWMAVATPEGVYTQHHHFGDHRGRNIEKTQLYAANFLRKLLLKIKS